MSFMTCHHSRLRERLSITCVALVCSTALAFSASAAPQCPPPDPAPPTIPLAQLRAGQYNVGMDNVVQFGQAPLRSRWLNAGGGKAGAAAVDAYLKTRPVPVVLGPGGELHLVDNHHRTTGIYTLSVEYGAPFPDYVYYYVIADFSNLKGPAFWARLIEGGTVIDADCNPVSTMVHQYLWPHNLGVLQDPNVSPPPLIPGLTDDILRTISASARFVNGFVDFEDEETPNPDLVFFFQEFYWANFLRSHVFLEGANWETRGGNPSAEFVFHAEPGETPAQTTKRLVATAALLCRGSENSTLPGWARSADVYADRVVNANDISAVLGAFGSTVAERYGLPTADVNRDGAVDALDLAEVIANWGS